MRCHKTLRILVALAVAGISGYFLLPYLEPAPKITIPTNLDRLDPAVRALIRAKASVAKAAPRSADTHGDLGLVYEANLLWEEAKSCFETAVRLSPDDLVWSYHLAIAQRQSGDYNSALALLRTFAICPTPLHTKSTNML